MIATYSLNGLINRFEELSLVPEKLIDLIGGELTPDSKVLDVFKVKNGKYDTWILVTEDKLMVFWMMKLFFIKRFPTIQEFHLAQINKLDFSYKNEVRIFASASEDEVDENYEEAYFKFFSNEETERFKNLIRTLAIKPI